MSRTLRNVTVTDKLDTKYLTTGSFRNSNLTNDKLDSLSCFYDNILINNSNSFLQSQYQNIVCKNLTTSNVKLNTINLSTISRTDNITSTNYDFVNLSSNNINVSNTLETQNTLFNDSIKNFKTKLNLFQPDTINNNLVTWFDASVPQNIQFDNSNKIIKVYNKYSSTYDFIAADNTGLSYDSTKKAIYFDGDNLGYFECTLPNSMTTELPYCLFICFEYLQKNKNIIFDLLRFPTTNVSQTLYYNETTPINYYTSSTQIYNFYPNKLIITINHESSNLYYVYLNGIYSHSIDVSGYTDVVNKLFIGNSKSSQNSTNNFKGWIYELFLYNVKLTVQQVGNLVNYLNDKWKVYDNRIADIFIASGQSNMVGTGNQRYANETTPLVGRELTQNFYDLDKKKWKIGSRQYGITSSVSKYPAERPQQSGGGSSGGFSAEYYRVTGREAYILYNCVGAVGLGFPPNRFNPYNVPSSTNLVNNFIYMPNYIDNIFNETNIYEIGYKNILWHQGEANGVDPDYQTSYLKLYDVINLSTSNYYDNFFNYEISIYNPDFNFPPTTGIIYNSLPRAVQRKTFTLKSNMNLIYSCYFFGWHYFAMQYAFNDQVHYSQLGFNEMGRQGARSSARFTLKRTDYKTQSLNVQDILTLPNYNEVPNISVNNLYLTYSQQSNSVTYSINNSNVKIIQNSSSTILNNIKLSKNTYPLTSSLTSNITLNISTLLPSYIISASLNITLPTMTNAYIGTVFQIMKTTSSSVTVNPPSTYTINDSLSSFTVSEKFKNYLVIYLGLNNFYICN